MPPPASPAETESFKTLTKAQGPRTMSEENFPFVICHGLTMTNGKFFSLIVRG
jgi:hypothetical protein